RPSFATTWQGRIAKQTTPAGRTPFAPANHPLQTSRRSTAVADRAATVPRSAESTDGRLAACQTTPGPCRPTHSRHPRTPPHLTRTGTGPWPSLAKGLEFLGSLVERRGEDGQTMLEVRTPGVGRVADVGEGLRGPRQPSRVVSGQLPQREVGSSRQREHLQ